MKWASHTLNLFAIATLLVSTLFAQGARPAPTIALQEIAQLFSKGEFLGVVEKVDSFVKSNPSSQEDVAALFMKAESEYQIERFDAAVATFKSALAQLPRVTNNVTRRQFAPAYFRFGQILRERKQLGAAVTAVEDGLRLIPQDVRAQIFLGQLLSESGQDSRALAHYRTQLASSLPVAEERAVLSMKAERLTNGRAGSSLRPAELTSTPTYSGLSIGIVPVNGIPSDISLPDVCLILQATWQVRCEVLPPLRIPESTVLDVARNQYRADTLLREVDRRLPPATRRQTHILAVTGRDIFAPQTSFVFSWQQRNETRAVGVLSTMRFVTDIPDYYEPTTIATRRVALQALSSTGSMFRFERPTDPECPLAYPESLREFQQKRLRLCPSEQQARDQLLRRLGGSAVPTERAKAEAVAEVQRKYFIE